MADTMRGWCPGAICDDCGRKGFVVFVHWGPLAPKDGTERVHDCMDCWHDRLEYYLKNGSPMLRGVNMSKQEHERSIHQCAGCGDGFWKVENLNKHRAEDHAPKVAAI